MSSARGILAEYQLIATKGEKINLGGKIYNISYKTNGAVKISDNVSYNGVITKALPRFTSTGNLGLKFFRSSDVIFDFDRNYMYITKDPGI